MVKNHGRKIIIVFEISSGKILGIKRSGDIHRRAEVARIAGREDHRGLGFVREPREVVIDLENDRCFNKINGEKRMLFGIDGMAKYQRIEIERFRERIKTNDGVLIESRPGIGDFIMGCECAAGLMKIYPDKKIVVKGPDKYKKLCSLLRPQIEFWDPGGSTPGGNKEIYIDQRIGFQFDPRGGEFGHVAKYGVYLGEEKLQGEVKLRFEDLEREKILSTMGWEIGKIKKPTLGIHIKSASSGTRSWLGGEALVLGKRWRSEKDGDVILFGERNQFKLTGDGYWYVEKDRGVLEGAAAVSACDVLVCVDSGPMHLARIQGIKSIILWGGTRPGIVLGRGAKEYDIMGDVGCGFEACHICTRKRVECMESITAERVWEKIEEV